MPFADRRRRLMASIEPDNLDALLVSSETNVGYLTGFTGDSSALLLSRNRAIVVSDGRFAVQLEQECAYLEVGIRPIGQHLQQSVGDLVKSLGVGRLGFESQATTVADLEGLTKAAEGIEFVPLRGKVEAIRIIKDATEIAAIREAIGIAERAFLDLRDSLFPGQTEKAAADFLCNSLQIRGATSASFPPTVAFGRRSALPHARPTQDARLGYDDIILIDWGAVAHGYKSDLTRVMTIGTVNPDFAVAYRVVLEAQRRAIEAIRPGVAAKDVDLAARSVIGEAGLGTFFNHSVGHGIGLEVHEAPVLRHVTETVLEPGMVVTVEPGVYFADWGGIRIEDDVLVTESGCEVLSTLAKSPESVVL
jgi:Xaa-Pro aminopeptidase